METQKHLFQEIKKRARSPKLWIGELADVLSISRHAVYRRESGDVLLTIQELQKISGYYGILMDTIFRGNDSLVSFRYYNLNIADIDGYIKHLLEIKKHLTTMSFAAKKEIFFRAEDIPMFHLFKYPELTYFKLYVWSQSLKNFDRPLQYEEFLYELKRFGLESLFYDIYKLYTEIPSREIWTNHTTNAMLGLLDYYDQIGSFAEGSSKQKLWSQLNELILALHRWTTSEVKDDKSRFDLYLAPVDMGISQMLSFYDGQSVATVKLHTTNCITTSDSQYIADNLKWVKAIMKKSSCLSRTSEKKRVNFFKDMHRELDDLKVKLLINV
ncbi:helix-turn-helix transcriptional regulator [Sphingobacterium oryzagri]|uniref:Helix-turn-helix transcriptional regulator n=1 Tax=Sphingobacterium oryzagri TaxID=3025669 RepID=A0ABY7WEK5_9SPHI|nr:helix-turn-helix transcriptional regulator [Sphingobacterium sp. KACC 22765]WDF67044.1 helix-turn-helix transcriptional regulator [Sphingobacterium sp. KACC 22765]